MPTCKHCHEKWTYMETMKYFGRSYMVCPYCKQLNYQSEKSRKRDVLIGGFVPLPFIIIFITFNVPYQFVLATGLLFLIAFVASYPFTLDITKEQERR